ncbi:unnamed protein product [Effrenium voratum]|nr:unnamed protein product [Effrenium voratum]
MRSTALGVVELLMGSLDTFKEPELQEIILAAYRDLAANRRSRHRMTVRGTWKQIMTEVQARQDLPQLQVFGCDLVELQTRDCEHDNIEDVIVFGGVESLLKVFATHAQDVDVQIRSCVAAEKLARRSADIKDMLIKGHLIQLIVDIMGRHRGSDVLQQLACMVLLSLVDVGPESRQEMVDSGCLEAACSALKEHDCWAVQCKALVLLAELAAAPEDTDARKLLASDGLRLVLKAMQVCVDSMEVQREGCSLLAAFGNDDASFFQAILNCDGLTAVVAGMRAHAAQNHVQQEATQLLRLIAEFSPEGKEDVISAGAIEAILDGMNENRKSDELALRGCVSLALLAKGNAAAVARIAKHKGAKHIVRAMLSNRTWAELQENALEALRAISADSARGTDMLRMHGAR